MDENPTILARTVAEKHTKTLIKLREKSVNMYTLKAPHSSSCHPITHHPLTTRHSHTSPMSLPTHPLSPRSHSLESSPHSLSHSLPMTSVTSALEHLCHLHDVGTEPSCEDGADHRLT